MFAPLVTVALACGARRGELLGAKWDDVDFARGTLSIRRSLEQTKAGVAEKTPKSGKSRLVHLPETALETLRRHRVSQGRLGPGYIFPGDDAGNPWTPQKVSDGFRALAKRAKISGASFPSLRHTCASMLLAQGSAPQGGPGNARAFYHRDHDGPLFACYSVPPGRGCDQAGRRIAIGAGRGFGGGRVGGSDLKVTRSRGAGQAASAADIKNAYRIRLFHNHGSVRIWWFARSSKSLRSSQGDW